LYRSLRPDRERYRICAGIRNDQFGLNGHLRDKRVADWLIDGAPFGCHSHPRYWRNYPSGSSLAASRCGGSQCSCALLHPSSHGPPVYLAAGTESKFRKRRFELLETRISSRIDCANFYATGRALRPSSPTRLALIFPFFPTSRRGITDYLASPLRFTDCAILRDLKRGSLSANRSEIAGTEAIITQLAIGFAGFRHCVRNMGSTLSIPSRALRRRAHTCRTDSVAWDIEADLRDHCCPGHALVHRLSRQRPPPVLFDLSTAISIARYRDPRSWLRGAEFWRRACWQFLRSLGNDPRCANCIAAPPAPSTSRTRTSAIGPGLTVRLGPCILGDVLSAYLYRNRLDFTCIGPAVNRIVECPPNPPLRL